MNHLLESLISKAKIDPEPRVYFRICEEYRKQDDVDNVIIYAKLGLEYNGNYLPLLLALGKAFQEREDYELAIPYYQNVLALDSANVRANHGLALCFIQLGFAGEAEVNMQNLKLLQPEFVEDLQRQINAIVDEPAQEMKEPESNPGPSHEGTPDGSKSDSPMEATEVVTEISFETDLDNDPGVENEIVLTSDRPINKLKSFLEKIRS